MLDLDGKMNQAGLYAATSYKKNHVKFKQINDGDILKSLTGYLKKVAYTNKPYPHNTQYLNGVAAFVIGDNDMVTKVQ